MSRTKGLLLASATMAFVWPLLVACSGDGADNADNAGNGGDAPVAEESVDEMPADELLDAAAAAMAELDDATYRGQDRLAGTFDFRMAKIEVTTTAAGPCEARFTVAGRGHMILRRIGEVSYYKLDAAALELAGAPAEQQDQLGGQWIADVPDIVLRDPCDVVSQVERGQISAVRHVEIDDIEGHVGIRLRGDDDTGRRFECWIAEEGAALVTRVEGVDFRTSYWFELASHDDGITVHAPPADEVLHIPPTA